MTKPASVPKKGTGHISVLTFPPLAANAVAPAGARPVRFTVEAEGGLGVDLDDYVKTVETVLFDERGWETRDHVRFVNVTPAEAAAGASVDVRITLASPTLTDTLCAPLQTMSSVSCFQRGRSVLNVTRWVHGAAAYGTDSATYRVYQINHEVGHGIGHGHQLCPAEGRRAPVMVQQTLGLHGCLAWPYPVGA